MDPLYMIKSPICVEIDGKEIVLPPSTIISVWHLSPPLPQRYFFKVVRLPKKPKLKLSSQLGFVYIEDMLKKAEIFRRTPQRMTKAFKKQLDKEMEVKRGPTFLPDSYIQLRVQGYLPEEIDYDMVHIWR